LRPTGDQNLAMVW
ncbi:unnamed protein product, partial [Rotaria sp. Silwood2]